MKWFAIFATSIGLLLAIAAPRVGPRVAIVVVAALTVLWCLERIREVSIAVPLSDERIRRRRTRQPQGTASEVAELEQIIATRHTRVDIQLRRHLTRVAAHRLRARHGIDLWNVADAPRAHALVTPRLWSVIDPHLPVTLAKTPVLIGELPDLLTELEQL
jgi:hypothetical protein